MVGSGGGGGTIAWMLAKAGLSVVLLEQGDDLAKRQLATKPHDDDPEHFNRVTHNEYQFRLKRPDFKRRLRGDYKTYRANSGGPAKPFKNGWTGTNFGGGTTIWGTWAYRALPIDFKLQTVFDKLDQTEQLTKWGYDVADWPVSYRDLEPFYNVTEALLAVSGDRQGVIDSVQGSQWFRELAHHDWFHDFFPAAEWEPAMQYPCPPYPRTPVGQLVFDGMAQAGMQPCTLPSAIVPPGSSPYHTREAIERALALWPERDRNCFWKMSSDKLWSERVRQACTLCGFCGEYLCWGGARSANEVAGPHVPGAPKSGTHSTVLQELRDMENSGKKVELRLNAKVYEIDYDAKTGRATGVKFLDVSNPDHPCQESQAAEYVIVSCGAVQSARLLWMSGPSRGLGNSSDQLGRNVTFHLFGMSVKATFNEKFQGKLHAEFGHTGNTTTFAPYFVHDATNNFWFKSGTMTSTAGKNPLEKATDKAEKVWGLDLLKEIDTYNRTVEVRLTANDLPRPTNRVDLDPAHVDEYGFPVARITRDVGEHEKRMYQQMIPQLRSIFDPYSSVIVNGVPTLSAQTTDLIGDHQMGTCRMGHDPKTSVLNSWCRLHDVDNVFVVDTSFMPTGCGLNPMMTVVANALRVGTHIIEELKAGRQPGND